jgi:acyl-coenzyme A synthetase/AMP-(fatty) acid ligase
MGYSLNKDDLRKKTRNKQILKTGDFAWKDDQGYYFLVGRKDSFVKISGLRVNLNEIKNLLEKQKIFSEIVKKKEKIVIFTTSSKNQDQITSLIFSEFKLNKGFFKIVKIKKFTRNSRGKVNLNLVDYND